MFYSLFSALLKYFLEGLAVSIAAYLVTGYKSTLKEIVMLGVTAGLTFLILDLWAQKALGSGARQGAGFGLGLKAIGGWGGFEGFDSENAWVDETEYGNANSGAGETSCEPYRFPDPNAKTCPQQPSPGSPIRPYINGRTQTKSRWMDWIETNQPINSNTCDYKILPGLYSKYIVQPGYREGIQPSNEDVIDQLAPTIWPTKNPLDQRLFTLKEDYTNSVPKKKTQIRS